MSNNKLLTVGMATYDDFDGVYFTIQSLLLYHNIFNNIDYEIIIIDNNPESNHGKLIKKISNFIKTIRYIPYTDKVGTSVRNEIFSNAKGKYTLSIDCHILIQNGGINSLLDYFDQNINCKDIISGPMLYDDQKKYSTQFDPNWRGNMYGTWGTNVEKYEEGKPFEIPMMGLGLFACETNNWQGFNPLFRGFGGEEGYIHEKFRRSGGKAICIPQLKWLHRFGRPNGVLYPLNMKDRIWNYFIGWLEITQDPEHEMIKDIYKYFISSIPNQQTVIENIFIEAKNHYNMI